jgi:hypothetical protein
MFQIQAIGTQNNNRQIKDPAKEKQACHTLAGPLQEKLICSSSYDGSFSIFFYAYALQFYGASSFYHKAF